MNNISNFIYCTFQKIMNDISILHFIVSFSYLSINQFMSYLSEIASMIL